MQEERNRNGAFASASRFHGNGWIPQPYVVQSPDGTRLWCLQAGAKIENAITIHSARPCVAEPRYKRPSFRRVSDNTLVSLSTYSLAYLSTAASTRRQCHSPLLFAMKLRIATTPS